MRPRLSVIVPTRDRADMLERCLASIRGAVGDDDEIVVVDSASRDAPRVAAIATERGARLVRCDQPGVNRARNAGWRAAYNQLLAYVDDDVVVDETWADALATTAAANPAAAFITGRVAPLAPTAHGNVAIKDGAVAQTLDRDTTGDLGHGANVLVRASALAVVGGWDEAMGVGARFKSAPETDLYDRLFAAGFSGRYEPSAVGYHDQHRNQRELIRLDWRYGYGNGARIAKLVRTDRRRARRVAGEAAWGWGLRRLVDAARYRNKTDAARVSARLAGTLAGFVRGAASRVNEGHYDDGRSNTSS
ncbi:MAG: glycosyltransferase [Acidimicrobiales bacterium]|nr:glycosyltransferase [Acidimicrobiales bacterium]